MSLIVSISGVRGIVGESLSPDVVVRYVSAFAEYCGGRRIVMGRDGRSTGKIIANIASSTLLAMGCDVTAIGVSPTPTIQLAVEHSDAAGGISVTASHNPMQWNGLKFIGQDGLFLDAEQNRRLQEIADRGSRQYARWEKIGTHKSDDSFLQNHIERVLALRYIEGDAIKKRRLKIVVDCVNAAGGVIAPKLLRELGCTVVEMNCDVSGIFAHPPEPIPENLGVLCKRVVDEKADLGIAVDPDADRLVLITEKGEPFGEENTIVSAVKFVLGKEVSLPAEALPASALGAKAGRQETGVRRQETDVGGQKSEIKGQILGAPRNVVVNLSTTRAVEDVAREFGARVIRTPVGEINVAKKMKEIGAIIGGEGSGGVILPSVHFGRDAIVGIGLVVQLLAEFDGTLSSFKASLPQYVIVKNKVDVRKDVDHILLAIRRAHNGKVNTDDGVKIDFDDSWVHLRKSNTEPIIRIIAEARTLTEARELVTQFQQKIQSTAL